jgi:predicted ATPase/transcriptional regulator with XRE-family HTH domain
VERERPPSFGELLREVRLAGGLSQEMLAERARISTEAISALERGRRKTPQRETLELLLAALAPNDALRARLKAAAVPAPTVRRRGADVRAGPDAQPNSGRPGNLLRPLTTFVGRGEEFRALDFMVTRHRLVTVTGTGGVGKTRAALEFAFKLADGFADGAWFIELGPLSDSALVPKAIAAALAIAERIDTPLLDVIVATLRDKQLLFVLDNCEHVIDAAADTVYAILTRCPQVKIVAASREPLRVDGEAVYRLAALDVPDDTADLTPEAAVEYSAVALFVERSRSRDAAFALTAHSARYAAEICRRLDGIPLAIELAAAKTGVLSLEQIAQRLDERFSLLTSGARTALPHHQTLRALIDWSFDLLRASEQRLFCRLAVFAGSWNVGAAEAVTADVVPPDDVLGLLLALVEKSLVVTDTAGNDMRFRLLETTREYAAEKLRENNEFQAVMRLHTSFVLTFTRHARAQLKDAADAAWLDRIETELESIRTALKWSLRGEDDVAAGAEIAATIGFFWDSRSWDEGTRWLLAARSVLNKLEPRLQALVLAELVRLQPTNEETFELAKRSLEAYREVNDDLGVATALEYLGQTLINLGRYGEAVECLEEGVPVARRVADAVTTLRMLALLAFAHLYGGDIDVARQRLADARALLAPNTRVRDHTLVLRVDAEIAFAGGDVERAVIVAQRTLALSEQAGDVRRIGTSQYLVAHALAAAGRISEARVHAVAAVRTLADAQIPFALAEAYLVAASIYERLPDDERAARLIGFARARAAALSFRSAFLVRGLIDRSMAAVIARLGQERFDRLAAQGAALTEAGVSAELDAGEHTASANAVSEEFVIEKNDAGDAHVERSRKGPVTKAKADR